MTERARPSEEDPPRAHLGALVAGCVLVLGAAVVLLWSAVTTASGRIAASTSNESSFVSAALVDLAIDGQSEVAASALRIDASNMYPGLVVQRCIDVTLEGDVDTAAIRLFGNPDAGVPNNGLDEFVTTTVERGTGGSSDCDGFVRREGLFDGTLREFWTRHGGFEQGLSIDEAATSGSTSRLRIALEVVDDNRAQGLGFGFWLTLEARP